MTLVQEQVIQQTRSLLGSFSLKKSAPKKEVRPEPTRFRCEQSLLFKILMGQMQPPHAAAIGYLDDSLLRQTSLSPEAVKTKYMEGLPVVANALKTAWGTIVTVILPRFQSEIFTDQEGLLRDLKDAFELCKTMGVKYVSLTGLIPSATNYGRDILPLLDESSPRPTTGHATTTACMLLNIQRVLKEAGRSISDETVAFLGLGSVGLATLRLLLRALPHPKQITLCDVYAKKERLEEIAKECVKEYGFCGTINVRCSRGEAPLEVYNHSLIIGATNVPDILDVDRLRSGTCIVDDSAPHCFDSTKAIRRVTEKGDIFITEGGPMRVSQPLSDFFYFPKRWEVFSTPEREVQQSKTLTIRRQTTGTTTKSGVDAAFDVGMKKDPREIMGCTFSGLLCAQYPHLSPSVGEVDVDATVSHYHKLIELGFSGCDLSCDDFVFESKKEKGGLNH